MSRNRSSTEPSAGAGNDDRTARLPRRFYETVSIEASEGGWRVLLDGREVRTPGRRVLHLPTHAAGEAVAEEWQAQGERIDPETMEMTKLANTALDRVAGREPQIVEDIVAFAGTDLLCYSAENPESLVAAQAARWDPVLAWAGQALGVELSVGAGVMYFAQPEPAISRLRARLAAESAWVLTGVHNMTTLTGSAMLAMARRCGQLCDSATWQAAHVDEDWQIARWGEDHAASLRRSRRLAEFEASARFITLVEAGAQS